MNESPVSDLKKILVFTLEDSRHALPLSVVERVIRVVEITPLSKVPEFIPGVINFQGKVLPVIDIRKRLGLPWREMLPDHRFIIARTSRRVVAILADSVIGIPVLSDTDLVRADKNLPFAGDIIGLIKLDEELIPVYDLDQLLPMDVETAIPRDVGELHPESPHPGSPVGGER